MARALFNDTIIAESDTFEEVEGNVYFPPGSVKREHLAESETTSVCPWKGTASYYNVTIDGDVAADAAWYYPTPKEAAAHIKDHVAFWKGVVVER